jgi:hypothetical protein
MNEKITSYSSYTPYQLFILAYLTEKESEQQHEEKIFGQYSPGLTARFRIETNISELATLVTPSIIPSADEDADTMMRDIEEQVSKLIRDCFIEYEHNASDPSFRGAQCEDIHITPKGKYFIRKYFVGLTFTVQNKHKYESIVDQADASTELKSYLKSLYVKLKYKSQDEMVNVLLSTVKQYGLVMITVLINLTRRHYR